MCGISRVFAALIMLCAVLPAGAVDGDRRFELDLAYGWVSFAPSPFMEYYIPPAGPRLQPTVDGRNETVQEVTVAWRLGQFRLFGSWEPPLEVDASFVFHSSGNSQNQLTRRHHAEASAADLGVDRAFSLHPRLTVIPHLALSNQRVSTRNDDVEQYLATILTPQFVTWYDTNWIEHSAWGLRAGAAIQWRATSYLRLDASLLGRWGTGTLSTDHHGYSTHLILDGPTGPWLERSPDCVHSSSSRATLSSFGASASVSVELSAGVALRAGWRWRDWSADQGPGRWDGPFAGLTLRM